MTVTQKAPVLQVFLVGVTAVTLVTVKGGGLLERIVRRSLWRLVYRSVF